MLDAVANQHPLIRIPAFLSGPDGSVSRCFVETWKERSSTGRTYIRCRIVDDPPDLSDGEYMVEFAEQSVRTHKSHGRWELAYLCQDLEITDVA